MRMKNFWVAQNPCWNFKSDLRSSPWRTINPPNATSKNGNFGGVFVANQSVWGKSKTGGIDISTWFLSPLFRMLKKLLVCREQPCQSLVYYFSPTPQDFRVLLARVFWTKNTKWHLFEPQFKTDKSNCPRMTFGFWVYSWYFFFR